jgi:hypothetical protein
MGIRVTKFLARPKSITLTWLPRFPMHIVGLNITVDGGPAVDVLDTGDELVGQEQDGLCVEQVFQAGTKEIENHEVEVTIGSERAHERNFDTASEGLAPRR